MYHNSPNRIELHDDVIGVEDSKLDIVEGEPVRLHMTYILRPTRQYVAPGEGQDVRVHSTNGVQHRWYQLGEEDPNLLPLHQDNVSPVLNGQNREMYHNVDGDPMVSLNPLTNANNLDIDAPNSASETRRYPGDLAYNPSDFKEDGSYDEAQVRLRQQQEFVDATTAKKRKDGTAKDAPANSLTEKEVKREEKRDDKNDEKKDK